MRVACCFEAGYDGFWLHRWLCAHDMENRVFDAASMLVDRRAKRTKTDRLDAAGLLRTLIALKVVRAKSAASCVCPRRSRKTHAAVRVSAPGLLLNGASIQAASRGCL